MEFNSGLDRFGTSCVSYLLVAHKREGMSDETEHSTV